MKDKLFERWRPTGLPGVEASSYGRVRRHGKITNAKQIHGQYRHRLICRAWHGPANGRHVQFKHGRSDHPSNLYYSNRSAIARKSANPRRGERHGNHKLTNAAVRYIRESDETLSALAKRYKVWPQTIWQVRTKSWRHVK